MRSGRSSVAIMVFCVLVLSCSRGAETLTITLVDGSCSRGEANGYAQSWRRIVDAARPGDRLVLGRIRGDLVAFRPDVDAALPAVPYLLDNDADQRRRMNAFQQELDAAFTASLGEPCSDRTPILDTLVGVGQFFKASNHTSKRLVLLSDALEDAGPVRFSKFTEADEPSALIERLRQHGALPDLAGVDVYVAGASAPTSSLYRTVQRFWLDLFAATGARLSPEHYGPVLIGWTN